MIRTLGRGSVATVYQAHERSLDRPVAVKVLSPQMAQDDTVRRRFEREARSAARISHPNVVAVHRVGRLPDETPYIVMEYIDGRNLEDLLEAEGAPSMEDGRELLRGVAEALAAAHAQNIIHRDLKPANIMRERDTRRVVLSDFGLAAVHEMGQGGETRLTVQGQLLGDVHYASPEHLLGEPLTPLADVYSFGMLAYQILARSTPYQASGPLELTTAHLRAEPVPIRQLRADVDERTSKLLERCLARRPEHRPAAADVARTLGAISGPTGASATTASPDSALGSLLGELKRRRVYRVAVAYAGGSLVALEGLDIVRPALGVSDGAYNALVLTVMSGFPVAMVLAWVFDYRSGRIERTRSTASSSWLTRSLAVVALLAALALAGLGARWLLVQ